MHENKKDTATVHKLIEKHICHWPFRNSQEKDIPKQYGCTMLYNILKLNLSENIVKSK